jgi:hypothetical protein
MTRRYCGEVTLTIELGEPTFTRPNDWYRVKYSAHRRKLGKPVIVNAPVALTYALDSSEAFDHVARAAMSFAPDFVQEQGEYSDDTHWLIRRYKCDSRSRGSR